MSEPKPFASLSSGLLARKGAARPAMRPQGFSQSGAGLEDLGWNDMGFEPPKPALAPVRDADHDGFGDDVPAQPLRNPLSGLSPVHSPVHSQQAEIADRLIPEPEGNDEETDEEFDETAELLDLHSDAELPVPMVKTPIIVAEPEAEPVECFEPEVEAAADYEPEQVQEILVPALPKQQAVKPRAPKARAVPGSKAKAAFTLRLDPDRHLKLRLACAVGGRSAQMLVTNALDALLAEMPELDAMAEKAKRKG